MKEIKWPFVLGVVLIALSALFYFLHYWIFHDPHHIFIYLVGDIAFVPIEVLLVSLIIHRALNAREKRLLLNKLNMVISSFFGDFGNTLLKVFLSFDENAERLTERLASISDIEDEGFKSVKTFISQYNPVINLKRGDIKVLKKILVARREFLLKLLENQNLLEHESFTDLLWAIFHLSDEITHREFLDKTPQSDEKHLEGDITRAYRHMLTEWLGYLKHLKANYPYLYSLVLRTNPFNPEASIVVQ